MNYQTRINYGIHLTYEATHRPFFKVRHGCWAGSKEQRKLIDYHKKMNIPLREIKHVRMSMPLERTN